MGKMGEHDSTISLRRLDVSDLDHYMVWSTDPRVALLCSWEPQKSREDALRFMESVILPHPYFRGICMGGRLVGGISITRNSGKESIRGELGYALAYEYWGKGIAAKAVRLAVEEAFEERKGELERVEALVALENLASQRVLEKAGFKRDGELMKYFRWKGRTWDMVMFSRLSTDP